MACNNSTPYDSRLSSLKCDIIISTEEKHTHLMHSLCLEFAYCLPAVRHIHIIRTCRRLRKYAKFSLEIVHELLHSFCANCRFLHRLAVVLTVLYNRMLLTSAAAFCRFSSFFAFSSSLKISRPFASLITFFPLPPSPSERSERYGPSLSSYLVRRYLSGSPL